MKSRAEIVDENFLKWVKDGNLPPRRQDLGTLTAARCGLTAAGLVDLFESQVMSRHLDIIARVLKTNNESFYTIGSSGHEGNAAFGKAFRHDDMAFLHYRSGAFFIQRSKQLPGSTPIYDICLSLVASADDPISAGRHKVFGSVPLFVPPQTSTIASHLPKAVGTALAIGRAADLQLQAPLRRDAVILCSFGDASHNHATALSAFNTASWCAYQKVPVPIAFICEDNGLGISVPTPRDWISVIGASKPGIKYWRCDGRDLLDTYQTAKEAEAYIRLTRMPAFIHMQTVRLLGHAGSDVETLYATLQQIETAERDDPLLHSARLILDHGFLNADEIIDLYETVRQRVTRAAREAIPTPKLLTVPEVMESLTAPKNPVSVPPLPEASTREALFGNDFRYLDKPQHMAKLINWGLQDILSRYPNTLVFGEDVAQKGGVYHVTAGLWQKFGSRRVFNSPLDETSILGTAIGMAHNGFLPIPEIQFLAYVHNAEDQLRGEASTLSYFSKGQYANPMIVRIAGLAYQKGFGGHFHNDNSLAVFRDLPGVIIACPSRGRDAVLMMRRAVRAAHEDGRIVIFIEPIALYMTKDLLEVGDSGWCSIYPEPEEEIEIGAFGVYGSSDKLTIITYGNGTFLSHQAAADLQRVHGVTPKIIDLRWLAPLNEEALAREIDGCEAVLIVDECRKTGSQSEALVTLLVERLQARPRIKRLTAQDCFIPLGKAATVLLPSRESIFEAAHELLTGRLPAKSKDNPLPKVDKNKAKKSKSKNKSKNKISGARRA
jgi:2-oxoisovalerate dehydrogenase E1 component